MFSFFFEREKICSYNFIAQYYNRSYEGIVIKRNNVIIYQSHKSLNNQSRERD